MLAKGVTLLKKHVHDQDCSDAYLGRSMVLSSKHAKNQKPEQVGQTCRAALSGRRRESEGRGLSPLPLISMRAKLLKPYLSGSAGFSEHCNDHHLLSYYSVYACMLERNIVISIVYMFMHVVSGRKDET